MTRAEGADRTPQSPAPAEIEIKIGGQSKKLTFEQAFVAACSLMERGQLAAASQLFSRLEAFTDRGPRAFIMHAFCECAEKHFDRSQASLDAAFGQDQHNVAVALQDAFVSYHVGIRHEGLQAIAELVDGHENLPTLCLLLGDMLHAKGDEDLAQRCWSLAVHRDRAGGAVAAAALRHLRSFSRQSGPNDPGGAHAAAT
jgi:thioredoxin-like negative regulator of GroEL